MEVITRLAALPTFHPRLLWADAGTAAAAILAARSGSAPSPIDIVLDGVPECSESSLRLLIDIQGISSDAMARFRRTYDPARLVELAAIAIAGLALYHAGGHEIRDVAARGSGADYLVNTSLHLLEIAGRSRRSDFASAWQTRLQRLRQRTGRGFYVCVVEFETPHARLAFES